MEFQLSAHYSSPVHLSDNEIYLTYKIFKIPAKLFPTIFFFDVLLSVHLSIFIVLLSVHLNIFIVLLSVHLSIFIVLPSVHLSIFIVLLSVHLSIFISVVNELDAQNLFHNKFYFMPLHVSSTCAHHQEVKIALHSLWYHHIYRCDDTRGCVMQFSQ